MRPRSANARTQRPRPRDFLSRTRPRWSVRYGALRDRLYGRSEIALFLWRQHVKSLCKVEEWIVFQHIHTGRCQKNDFTACVLRMINLSDQLAIYEGVNGTTNRSVCHFQVSTDETHRAPISGGRVQIPQYRPLQRLHLARGSCSIGSAYHSFHQDRGSKIA